MSTREIRSCEEVTAELIDATFDPTLEPHPAQRVLRLLERMARVAKPRAGAQRILAVLAKLAQADWMGGRLVVTLSDFGVATEVDVRVDEGSTPTRWRSFSMAVPLSELSQWVRQSPDAIRPLALFGEPRADRLQLRAQSAGKASSPAPAPPELDSSAPVSSKRGARPDVHRKQTIRIEAIQVPLEAFRAPQPSVPEKADQRDTARPPASPVKPAPGEPDPTDEGWD